MVINIKYSNFMNVKIKIIIFKGFILVKREKTNVIKKHLFY